MNKEIHIVSLVIHCLPGKHETVISKANALPQAECHFEKGQHKIVLLFEAGSESEISNYMDQINSWDGVLSVQLCYHHCESNESLQEEINHEIHAA